MISMTVLGSTSQGSDAVKDELRELCAYYLATDQWGRDHIMGRAKAQAGKHPIQLPCQLHLVPRSGLDLQTQLIDEVVNCLPLALVR